LFKIPHPRRPPEEASEEARPRPKRTEVNKSVLAIGAIGIAGCVLLSAMMKELASHKAPPRPGWLVALEVEFGEQLVGRLAAHEEDAAGLARMVVHGKAKAGSDRRSLALAIANSAGQLLRHGNALAEVQVTLRDPDGKHPQSALAPRAKPAR
jgi:hypothetical protein